jgi:thioester reductase-like protein
MTTNNKNVISVLNSLKGKNILITGVTGFLGKALLEKILRSKIEFKMLYVLIRSKKGVSPFNRFTKLLEEPYFKQMNIKGSLGDNSLNYPDTSLGDNSLNYPDTSLGNNIIPIDGDITKVNLGITKSINDELNVILSVAADVNFDLNFYDALNANVNSTQNMIQFAQTCKNLQAYIHISTAYVHSSLSTKTKVYEELTQLPFNIKEFIQDFNLAKKYNRPELIQYYQDKLLSYPNTYTMSKTISEHVLNLYSAILPIAIIRPTIINPAFREPIPGLVDTQAGSVPYILGMVTALVSEFCAKDDLSLDLVPVDYVVNGILIILASKLSINVKNKLTIYTISSVRNPLLLKEYMRQIYVCFTHEPATNYKTKMGKFYNSTTIPNLIVKVKYEIPSKILKIPAQFGYFQKQYKDLNKANYLANKLVNNYYYFVNNMWYFNDDNYLKIINTLKDEEKDMFNGDMVSMNWYEYNQVLSKGLRTVLLEDLRKRQLQSKL